MNNLIQFWHSLPFLIRWLIDFWFLIIFMRGVVAKDITSWLEDHGFIKKKEQSMVYRSLDFIYYHIKKLIPNQERVAAIMQHYRLDHSTESVVDCKQDKCAII